MNSMQLSNPISGTLNSNAQFIIFDFCGTKASNKVSSWTFSIIVSCFHQTEVDQSQDTRPGNNHKARQRPKLAGCIGLQSHQIKSSSGYAWFSSSLPKTEFNWSKWSLCAAFGQHGETMIFITAQLDLTELGRDHWWNECCCSTSQITKC
jgi:hypothetical protein